MGVVSQSGDRPPHKRLPRSATILAMAPFRPRLRPPLAPPPIAPTTPITALLFDMDGVLVDNSRAYGQAWETFLARHPEALLPAYPAALTFGRRNVDLFAEVFGPQPAERVAAMTEELKGIYWRIFQPQLRPIAGLTALLIEARERGLRLALATSAPRATMHDVVGGLGLLDPPAFDTFLTEEDVRQGKPSPEIYSTAAARLAQPPQHCLVFEDALVGLEAARRAGMRSVALATTYPRAQLEHQSPQLIVVDFTDPALRRLLGWE